MGYKISAWQYIKALTDYVHRWRDIDDIIEATEKVFWHTGKHAEVEFGSARIVIIGKDFVIKWDYTDCVKSIGGCEDEFRVYKQCLSTGYSHLLASCFRVSYRSRYFYIMPRVHNIGRNEHHGKFLEDYTTKEEYEWLTNNIGDLHSWNWGIENGKAIVIDYACR